MFTRKLRILFKLNERTLCSRLHSVGYVPKINLNLSQPQSYTNYYIKNAPINITNNHLIKWHLLRHSSNLSQTYESDDDDDSTINNDDGNKQLISENGYAHSVLINSQKFSDTILPQIKPEKVSKDIVEKILMKSYDETSPAEVLQDFKILTFYAKEHNGKTIDAKYEKILQHLKRYVSDFSDDEFKNLLILFEVWFPMRKIEKSKLFMEVILAIDNECVLRMNEYKVEDYLIFCDLFYRIRHNHGSFNRKTVYKLGNIIKQLKPEHYLHYMFILNSSRRKYENMYEMEYALEFIIDKFNGEELAIIGMSFFKTKTQIRNPLVLKKMIQQTIRDINTMGDISLSAMFKVIRYSIGLKLNDIFRQLLQAFQPRIKDTSVQCLVHIAHAAATITIYEKNIIDEIVNNFQKFIPSARIKDLERMLFSLLIFNYPKEIPCYNLIVQEFLKPERASEMASFPRCVSTSLMYLTHMGIYPLSIIEQVMNHDYLDKVYQNNPIRLGQNFLTINCALQIEVPEYKGPFLPERTSRYLLKRWSADAFNPEDPSAPIHAHQRLLFEVINHLRDILGATHFLVDQLLPHYLKVEIIFCINSENNFISPKPYFPQLGTLGIIKYAPKDPEGHRWLLLSLASHNQIIRDTSETCGTFNSRLRQLEKIGYTPITLLGNKWTAIKTIDGRKNYLRSLLFQNDYKKKMSINL